MEKTVLITGAGRGIGLELARQYAERDAHVIATVRDAAQAERLASFGARVEELDVADPGSVTACAVRLSNVPIDLLINNAGRQNRADRLEDLDFRDIADTFAVNTFGPLRVLRALLPNLRAGRNRQVAHVTSRMGCFGEFDGANMYAYRASKAALNMFHRCVAAELGSDGFTCVALHPGWVRTDMGGPQAALGVKESAAALMRLLEALAPAQNGKVLDWEGRELPW